MLSIQETNYIVGLVEKEEIHFSHLAAELIDHICCDVEQDMQNGISFKDAINKVETRIGYRGLKKIQEDTLYLIDKNYRIMKNVMKTTGIAGPALMGIGSLFKIMHWPGASILLILGFFFLCFFFLPSSAAVLYKESGKKYSKALYIFGFLAAFIFSAGILWKVQHWPGAGWLLLVGDILATLVVIPIFLGSKLKENKKSIKVPSYIIGFIALLIYIAGTLFKIMHWPGAAMMLMFGAILLFGIAIPMYTYHTYRETNHVKGSFIFIILASTWMIITSSMISLNVSTNIFEKYALVYDNLDAQNTALQKENTDIFGTLERNGKADKFNEVHQQSTSLIAELKQIRMDLCRMADVSEGADMNDSPFKFITNLDERSVPYNFMLGPDGSGRAPGLKKSLLEYISAVKAFPSGKDLISDMEDDLTEETWETKRFTSTLAFTLDYLALLEYRVLLIESECYIQENH